MCSILQTNQSITFHTKKYNDYVLANIPEHHHRHHNSCVAYYITFSCEAFCDFVVYNYFNPTLYQIAGVCQPKVTVECSE